MAKIVSTRRQSMHFDIDEKDLTGLEIGEELSVKVLGKVKSISAPYEYENEKGKMKKEDYGSISIRLTKIEIEEPNEFSDLAEAEE